MKAHMIGVYDYNDIFSIFVLYTAHGIFITKNDIYTKSLPIIIKINYRSKSEVIRRTR